MEGGATLLQESDPKIAKRDHVAIDQSLGFGDRGTIHEGAVPTTQILDDVRSVPSHNASMGA